jgi:hypothetical protein
MFQVTFRYDVDQKIRQMAKTLPSGPLVDVFWQQLTSLLDEIRFAPAEIGEAKYNFKKLKMCSYLVLRNFIAVQYAVNEEHRFVFVQQVAISGQHPYPPEFDAILSPKKS